MATQTMSLADYLIECEKRRDAQREKLFNELPLLVSDTLGDSWCMDDPEDKAAAVDAMLSLFTLASGFLA